MDNFSVAVAVAGLLWFCAQVATNLNEHCHKGDGIAFGEACR